MNISRSKRGNTKIVSKIAALELKLMGAVVLVKASLGYFNSMIKFKIQRARTRKGSLSPFILGINLDELYLKSFSEFKLILLIFVYGKIFCFV